MKMQHITNQRNQSKHNANMWVRRHNFKNVPILAKSPRTYAGDDFFLAENDIGEGSEDGFLSLSSNSVKVQINTVLVYVIYHSNS